MRGSFYSHAILVGNHILSQRGTLVIEKVTFTDCLHSQASTHDTIPEDNYMCDFCIAEHAAAREGVSDRHVYTHPLVMCHPSDLTSTADEEPLSASADTFAMEAMRNVLILHNNVTAVHEKVATIHDRIGSATIVETVRAQMLPVETRLRTVEDHMGAVDAKLEALQSQMHRLEERLDRIITRLEGPSAVVENGSALANGHSHPNVESRDTNA